MKRKSIHVKPQFYAYTFLALKKIAKRMGYNLVIHGSMKRDLDLIAIPWVNNPKSEKSLILALKKHLLGGNLSDKDKKSLDDPKILPGGRKSYVINLNRGGYLRNQAGDLLEPLEYIKDPQYYLDISVTPLIKIPESNS